MYKETKSKLLITYSIILIPVMIIIFSISTSLLGKTYGYFAGHALYIILILLGIFFVSPIKIKSTSFQKYKILYYSIAFLPVLATFFVAFLPAAKKLSFPVIIVTVLYAIFNSVSEELFWRYTYNAIYPDNIMLAYLIPTILFSLLHFAFLFAKGMSYHGGVWALVGGASFMGFLWGLVMFKTKNIQVVVIAHALTNFFAFSQLIYENWFLF
ncbi:CPBP family intramembrane glutamic endopeptidase [Clostridium polynesiense]|uniref:CPBP family intramembrane glutamic endopeptidase n=1 Tax=Clostridium polynesiense TaxID=1325933 RepID=UPI000591710D|nr:CPBP family intramembrane glutamic endopeptidase [Clostridium polynesiense]